MALLEEIREWLETCPGMENLSDFWIDDTAEVPDHGGIFPLGLTELERKEDILGNVEVLNQYQFQLYYVLLKPQGDDPSALSNAEWLMDFQDWVQKQSASGLVPLPGGADVYEGSAKAEKGTLHRNGEDGAATYTVVLTIKYKKGYEV